MRAQFDDSAELAAELMRIANNDTLTGEDKYYLRESATHIVLMHKALMACPAVAPLRGKKMQKSVATCRAP